MLIVGPALLAPFISHGGYSGNLEPSRVLADDFSTSRTRAATGSR